MPNRDIIAIGASAGGVEALQKLAAGLPPDLPASVFVVLHILPGATSALPGILARSTPIPVSHPVDGQPFHEGSIYIAPPDVHMLVGDGVIKLEHGPAENRSRPAIDPLFRSAAGVYGPRVISVLLSGLLDDGTAGMIAVTSNGGIGIAQDPNDAAYPDMPRSAVENEHPQYILPLGEIAAKLTELTKEQVVIEEGKMHGGDTTNADELVRREIEAAEKGREGQQIGISCPDCGGALFEIHDGSLIRFRCRIGHTFSPETMVAAHNDEVETALWAAVRILEEQQSLYGRIANGHREANRTRLVDRFEGRAKEAEEQASMIRRVILEKSFVTPTQ